MTAHPSLAATLAALPVPPTASVDWTVDHNTVTFEGDWGSVSVRVSPKVAHVLTQVPGSMTLAGLTEMTRAASRVVIHSDPEEADFTTQIQLLTEHLRDMCGVLVYREDQPRPDRHAGLLGLEIPFDLSHVSIMFNRGEYLPYVVIELRGCGELNVTERSRHHGDKIEDLSRLTTVEKVLHYLQF